MIPLADTPSRFPPGELALVHGDTRWTWGDLDRRSWAWAARLRSQGVSINSLVAFAFPNGPDFFGLVFGIYRVGATPAPLSPRLPLEERTAILGLMNPSAFVSSDDYGIALEGGLPDLPLVSKSWKACTSGGSTGRPKIIVDGRPAGFSDEMQFIGIPNRGRVLVPGPLYHNAPFSAAVFSLSRGSRVVTNDRFDADDALAIVERERVEWAIMVPTMMHRIMRLPEAARTRRNLSSWKMVVHTAAPMAPWLKHAWIDAFGPDHIWEAYGATEGLIRTFVGGREWMERPGTVGRPTGGARVRVLNTDLEEVPVGAEGELFAMPSSGPYSTYQYIGAERRATPDGWESVGDVGHVDADGYIFLADRRTDLIITGGVNVWPAEVESAILRHPSIRSCAVVGIPDDDRGQIIHAVIETKSSDLNLETLTSFLSGHLSRDKHPRSLERVATPVRDDAGKVRKSSLAKGST
jgi:bile acid-coenzyme A ligase